MNVFGHDSMAQISPVRSNALSTLHALQYGGIVTAFPSALQEPAARERLLRQVVDIRMDQGEALVVNDPEEISLIYSNYGGCQGVALMAYHPITGRKRVILTHYSPLLRDLQNNLARLETLIRGLRQESSPGDWQIQSGLYLPQSSVPGLKRLLVLQEDLIQRVHDKISTTWGAELTPQILQYDIDALDRSLVLATSPHPGQPFFVHAAGKDRTEDFYPRRLDTTG